jgi:hypothetical protein
VSRANIQSGLADAVEDHHGNPKPEHLKSADDFTLVKIGGAISNGRVPERGCGHVPVELPRVVSLVDLGIRGGAAGIGEETCPDAEEQELNCAHDGRTHFHLNTCLPVGPR